MIFLIARIAGVLLFLVGWWPAMRAMFYENRALGYMGFMVPLSATVFAGLHLDELKVPLILQLSGIALLAIGILGPEMSI